MDEFCRSHFAKFAGDLCGTLACACVGFAILAIILSFTVLCYYDEVWTVVSIMVGIAFAGLFTRLRLLLSYCHDCKSDDVFKPVFKCLIVFVLLGVGAGVILSGIYNEVYAVPLCWEIANYEDTGHSEEAQNRHGYQDILQQLLNIVLIVLPIVMVVWFVGKMYNVSRHIHCKQATIVRECSVAKPVGSPVRTWPPPGIYGLPSYDSSTTDP